MGFMEFVALILGLAVALALGLWALGTLLVLLTHGFAGVGRMHREAFRNLRAGYEQGARERREEQAAEAGGSTESAERGAWVRDERDERKSA